MVEEAPRNDSEAIKRLKDLLKAGMELGVPDAVRRAAQYAPILQSGGTDTPPATVGEALNNLIANIKNEPQTMLQLAKEVWSRGGPKQKESAASAVGRALGQWVPHRALQAAKELASMARDGREADLVGREAIEPILDRAPAMLDRVKQLLQDQHRLIRVAAIQALVAYVARKRKFAALGVELILMIAEEHEKEIRDAVKWGIRKIMEVDPKATAQAVGEWVKSSPTSERVQAGAVFLSQKASQAAKAAAAGVASAATKITNGVKAKANGVKRSAAKPRSKAKAKGSAGKR